MTSPLEQKKIKVTGPVVVTANRTGDGIVIYRQAEGWTTDLSGAAIATDGAGAQQLMAGAVADDLGAVGAYVAPVTLLPGGHVRPGNLRELIRLGGPTIELPAGLGKFSKGTRPKSKPLRAKPETEDAQSGHGCKEAVRNKHCNVRL